jgi:hypothetical protein
VGLGKEKAMLVMFLLAVLGGASIPRADINQICSGAQIDVLPEDRVTALRSCVGDETLARDQLRSEWGRFSAADKSDCASTPGMQFSYVELQTCLEMQNGGNFGLPGLQTGSSTQIAPLTPPSSPMKP